MAERYDPTTIEKKWQQRWEETRIYHPSDDDPRPKWYALTMFPYTSGDLHCGHWYAMAPSDVAARYKRMKGYKVFFPIGFDAFGLPAENAAIQRGIHPKQWTLDNVERMRGQLRTMGASFDWESEIITCLPEYYRWNQWLFLQFYKRGLAYRTMYPANWCPSCQTVLANEQVQADGTCERCKTPVTKRDLEQWFFKTTAYAEELLDHSGTQWPERVNVMQNNWIGKSVGVELSFPLERTDLPQTEIRVFTTRPDTIYGVTFMVLAPEHPLVAALTTPEQRPAVDAYVEATKRATEIERQSTERPKTGVFTGAYCINRFNGHRVPIFIADYVLMHYGTGAVMGVPGHDSRDFVFAQTYGLPIVRVIAPEGWQGEELTEAYVDPGVMVNSGPFDGLPSDEGKERIADHAEAHGWGGRRVTYRMHDWLISRQRYWGTPIPIVYCPDHGTVPVPEDQLPVLLPEDAEFRPTGESPLNYHPGFVNTTCPTCGKPARRETDTMDTFVDSSWYQMRYLSPHYTEGPFDPVRAKHWHPVDQYTGGAEHATMHLLYARFFHKVMRDLGLVDTNEPYLRLFNQGQILGPDGQRMSKSRGNVVAPDENVQKWGADTFRAYLMFLGPWDQGGPFNTEGITGPHRWINRVWNLVLDHWDPGNAPPADAAAGRALERLTHRTIMKVEGDLIEFRFNTMLAALMEYTNQLGKPEMQALKGTAPWKHALESLMLLIAPSVPHVAEELWERTGHAYSIHQQAFPAYDPELAADVEVTLIVQVNGKVRDRLTVRGGLSQQEAQELALASERVRSQINGAQVRQVIYVPDRLLNLVVR